MIDETTAGLLEAAGPQMYRRNAFRITGLPTNADRRAVRQRQQRITPALELGADVDLGHSLPVRLDDVRGAFDRILGDPRRRLVDELFWLWDGANGSANGARTNGARTNGARTNGASPTTCSCPKSLHDDHDAAVRAHSAALDLEIGTDSLSVGQPRAEAARLWSDASRLWGQVLRRAVFWDHVRHRIAVLDDRQLDESVIDTFRDAMPSTLVKPLIELAAAASAPTDRVRLAKLARDWPLVPPSTVDDQLEEAAAPHYESLRATGRRASSQLDGGNWDGAATEVYDHALPALAVLESLVPYARHRRTSSARNDVAVLLNNCATAATDALGPAANLNASKWFRTAAELATDPVTQQTVKTNRDGLRDMMDTFSQIKGQVDRLVASGSISTALAFLMRVKRQLAGGPGSEEIDRMMDDIRSQRLGAYTPPTNPRRTLLGALVVLVILGFLAAMIAGVFDDDGGGSSGAGSRGETAVVSAENITDNSSVGSCIEKPGDWDAEGREVAVVPCDQPHWGEVLSYVRLVEATSAAATGEYPGIDQSVALSRFRCELSKHQLLTDTDGLVTKFRSPVTESGDLPEPKLDEYTTCVVHWADDAEMVEGDVVRQRSPATDVSVPMNIFGGDSIADNAPVGSCVESKIDPNIETTEIPVVDCERPHWAEIVGYPVLYKGENTDQSDWPGDEAVFAKAEAACAKKAPAGSGVVHTTWPSQSWWDGTESPIYAMCAVSQKDGRLTAGGLL